jgi:dipeptidyl-peptidase-4
LSIRLQATLFFSFLPVVLLAQSTPPSSGVRTVAFANSNPAGTPPHGGSWSPDGKRLTFIATDAQIGKAGDLIEVDAASGRASVLATRNQLSSLTSASIDEKDADHRARYGMSSFLWSDDSKHLLLDNGGRLWLYDVSAGTGTMVVDTGSGSGDDPKFSPDAKSVSYLRDHNLYVHPVASGAETALTSTADPILNGEVDWVYLEELDVRSNYFWSPDSAAIAYLQADELKVPVFPIVDLLHLHASIDPQRYPQPGDPNPAVRVGVVSAHGGATRWINMPASPGNDYVPRFGWVDAHTLYIEVLARDQQHLDLYFADAATGATRLVYSDTDPKYLDENYDITFLPQGRFITSSWRDGHTQLYLYRFAETRPLGGKAKLVRQLTSGDFEVESIAGLAADRETLLYLSTEGNPRENNLWSITLDGKEKTRLTVDQGTHTVLLSPDGIHFADQFSSSANLPSVRICVTDPAQVCQPFWQSSPIPPADGVRSSNLQLAAADGTTKLYGTLTLPAGPRAPGSVPVILNPYGGPLPTAGVRNSFKSAILFNELLAQHGFAVLTVDNRGSGGRGRDFQQADFHNFGAVQLADQLASLDQTLAKYPQLDARRVGWWGWSWGGTFTLYAMTHTDRIRAGVAVAPVTDFRNYDSIYTERYLGLPIADAAVYKAASVTAAADDLMGHILIAHGTGDDNVHLSNTIQFVEALIQNGIPYDLQLFPGKTHSIAGATSRNELYNRILHQFEMYLK